MKVLIADDDAVTRKLLQRHLSAWGYDVIAAEDGARAWSAVAAHEDLNILLLDWMMPGMDGPDICRRVREAIRNRYVFIILITSRSGREDFLEGMESGADEFILKPVDPDELRVRLHSAERIVQLEKQLNEHIALLSEANERMREDLMAAARVQQGFFPERAPEIPGYRVAWKYVPCEFVAGDLLNVFPIDEDHWGFYVMDVSGHGVPAALLSVSLSRILTPAGCAPGSLAGASMLDPCQVVARARAQFPLDRRSHLFATLIYAVLDVRTHTMRWLRAGHEPPLWVRASGGHVLLRDRGSIFIGAAGIEAPDEQVHTLALAVGDRLFFYSDGLTESMPDTSDELFGVERLAAALAGERGELALALDRAVDASLAWSGRERFADDVTLLGVERIA